MQLRTGQARASGAGLLWTPPSPAHFVLCPAIPNFRPTHCVASWPRVVVVRVVQLGCARRLFQGLPHWPSSALAAEACLRLWDALPVVWGLPPTLT